MKERSVAIIGLGYVGLPLALLCSKNGHKTYGIDVDNNKIESIKKGINPIENSKMEYTVIPSDYDVIKDCDVVLVCVPTPVNEDNTPNLSLLVSCANSIKKWIKKGQLIVIESSVNPGAIDDNIKPILGGSLKVGKDFYLAHCPERIDPGNDKWDTENIPRVLGACSTRGLKEASEFYKSIINAEIKEMSSIKSAEAVKMIENSFRDVNIGFANEIAKMFDKVGLDAKEIIEGAATKPFGFMPHYPSCGVGGHCIPVDPYYLIRKSEDSGYEPKLLKLVRELNDSMPKYCIGLFKEELKKMGKDIDGAKVGILGLSYKANVGDLRNSPALEIIELLKEGKAVIEVFDSYAKEKSTSDSINEILDKSDYLIITVDHDEFKLVSPELLEKNNIKVLIDGKNMFNKDKIKEKGILYRGIGSK
ncbi:MAG: nucleotide sugar dehydrogenase [Nanoarchaeota archaeon]|nr:nucleotide sugar dehydrogenase [Nanoarchaeota archaeon]